jgi:hypothetical protein
MGDNVGFLRLGHVEIVCNCGPRPSVPSVVVLNPVLAPSLLNVQVNVMRKEAQEFMNSLLAELKAGTSSASDGNGSGQSQAQISQDVKAKLQNAIKVMQEGLVERDTEVCVCVCHVVGSCPHQPSADFL